MTVLCRGKKFGGSTHAPRAVGFCRHIFVSFLYKHLPSDSGQIVAVTEPIEHMKGCETESILVPRAVGLPHRPPR